MKRSYFINFTLALLTLSLLIGCSPERPVYIISQQKTAEAAGLPTSTPLPDRPVYSPGTIVDYIAQSGDTLPLLAARFGSSVQEIRIDNPQIPDDATTMPPGFPMKMRIYYKPFWGSQYQIIPDAAFVNGPDAIDFDLRAFLESTPGWFKTYETYVQEQHRDAVELIRWLSENYSLNPKILLALIEYQTSALSNPERNPASEDTFLGFEGQFRGVYLQLFYVGDLLNDGYYRFRTGDLLSIEHLDGRLENIDPWQNAATVSLMHYFSLLLDGDDYRFAVGADGFARTYQTLFGDPWRRNTTVLPGSLQQPELILPFRQGTTWAYTGGPHTGWGSLRPYAAIDFAPPTENQGCVPTNEYAVAMADGIVARTDPGTIMLDLDGDGDERTEVCWIQKLERPPSSFSKQEIIDQGYLGYGDLLGYLARSNELRLARKLSRQVQLEKWANYITISVGLANELETLHQTGVTDPGGFLDRMSENLDSPFMLRIMDSLRNRWGNDTALRNRLLAELDSRYLNKVRDLRLLSRQFSVIQRCIGTLPPDSPRRLRLIEIGLHLQRANHFGNPADLGELERNYADLRRKALDNGEADLVAHVDLNIAVRAADRFEPDQALLIVDDLGGSSQTLFAFQSQSSLGKRPI